MKLMIEVPDTTQAITLSYVYIDDKTFNFSMNAKLLGTKEIEEAKMNMGEK